MINQGYRHKNWEKTVAIIGETDRLNDGDNMKKTEVQKKVQAKKSDTVEKNYFYFDEKVKDFIYSDFVRINSSQRGMLFSFGKVHPELDKVVIINEVLLPLDVAFSLKRIIEDHIGKYVKEGVIQIEEEPDESTE